MIREPTVFVLGAGSSTPYQFPSGEKLVHMIRQRLDKRDFAVNVVDALISPKLEEFKLALAQSNPLSLDEFLQERQEFLEIGKVCIAQVLIPCEREDHFSIPLTRTAVATPHPVTRGWVRYLISQMLKGHAPGSNWSANHLSVVTFNFDRSFERIIFNALVGNVGDAEKARAMMQRTLEVVHVHGRLGAPDWMHDPVDRPRRRYTPDFDVDVLRSAAEGILIVHEEIPKEITDAVTRLFVQASRVCFLGFGYHPYNLTKLNLGVLSGKLVSGTAYGMTQGQLEPVIRRFKTEANVLFQPADHDVLDFLRNQSFLHE